jgi:hypothetical protein
MVGMVMVMVMAMVVVVAMFIADNKVYNIIAQPCKNAFIIGFNNQNDLQLRDAAMCTQLRSKLSIS